MKRFLLAVLVLLLTTVALGAYYFRGSHLRWQDLVYFWTTPAPIGVVLGDPLARLKLKTADLQSTRPAANIQYLGITRYLNNTQAAATHTIDDSTKYMSTCLDAMDKYGIKATVFVNTQGREMPRLWPRLRLAVLNGHEIGSHSRRHQCKWPDTFFFCLRAYTDYEVAGSRDDILAHTHQPVVWSWCYPCGNCARWDFVHRKLARAGYLLGRNYPGEKEGKHLVPDLQTYATNAYDASYTQVVQKKGGIAPSGRTNVPELNSKFDEVCARRGIYHFLSHPQWLDYGADGFYEQHLKHIGRRTDVWYVPIGPLYAYRTVVEKTHVSRATSGDGLERFAVYNNLDPKIFSNSITLEFSVPEATKIEVVSNRTRIRERNGGLTDRWDLEYFRRSGRSLFATVRSNTIVEIRTFQE